MGYFNFYFIRKILSKLFTKKTLIYIIIFLVLIILKSNVFAVNATYDVEKEMRDRQIYFQNTFAMHCVQPYINNTEYWRNCLLPIFQSIDYADYSFNVSVDTLTNGHVRYVVRIFPLNQGVKYNGSYTSMFDGQNYTVISRDWTGNTTIYTVDFDPVNNTGTMTVAYNQNFAIQDVIAQTKSEFLLHFIKGLYEGNIGLLLQDIESYISNIETINTDILSELQILSNTLTSLPSQFPDNTSQISSISNKISDLLTDNDTIISQNSQMIQQQEAINDNLEEVNDSVQELKDTITNPNIESGASDLPSTNVNDPTQSGIDNIFQSMYNAFCSGQAQDIVFPIPFTEQNITLSPYYVRDMLNNNNAGWVYTIIQAFWGYLIGRFIVYDVMKKVTKIKSGNIEELETNNIKGDML